MPRTYAAPITAPSVGSSPLRYSAFRPPRATRWTLTLGPRITVAPFARNSAATSLPYLCASDASQVAASASMDGQAVTVPTWASNIPWQTKTRHAKNVACIPTCLYLETLPTYTLKQPLYFLQSHLAHEGLGRCRLVYTPLKPPRRHARSAVLMLFLKRQAAHVLACSGAMLGCHQGLDTKLSAIASGDTGWSGRRIRQ
eukprot:scaffold224384_cov35-Tisochrysis_lutea.AAC.2